MKYFFIAGERSGDLFASKVIDEIKKNDPESQFYGWGGRFMAKSEVNILQDYAAISVMGFWEVVKKLKIFREKLRQCQQDILKVSPDVVVFVDFPGFNLPMLRFSKKNAIKTCYYITPKVWAWRSSRVRTLKIYADKILTIFPFEKDYFKRFGLEVEYVGNPLVEIIREYMYDENFISQYQKAGKIIAFLPGSRTQEIKSALEVILQLSEVYEDYRFLISGVDNVDPEVYDPIRELRNVNLIFDKTYEILKVADVSVVTSGTATLETALIKTPQIVVYKTSYLNYLLAKAVVKLNHISLVNLIAGREVVPELIQSEYNAIDVSSEIEKQLYRQDIKKRISEGYSEILNVLGNESASSNAAKHIGQLCSS